MRKNCRFASALCIALLIMTLAVTQVFAAGSFEPSRTFSDDTFSDVADTAWYHADVKSAYELGLVNGKGEGIFDPDGSMTVAEAITLAARMNVVYHEGDALEQTADGNWYDVYVDYAKEKGFLKDGQFDSFTRPIKRSEMAVVFASALPGDYYAKKNTVTKIPDVKTSDAYYDAVVLLYEAGIMMGSDDYGTFNPNANIKRSEVAAIVNRVAIPANRLEKTLKIKPEDNAFYLADNTAYTGAKSGTASGWSFDNRGGPVKTAETGPYNLQDLSTEFGTALIRDVAVTSSGTVVLETTVDFMTGFDGFFLQFTDTNGKPTYRLSTENGKFAVLGANGVSTALDAATDGTTYDFKITLDLSAGTSKTVINDVDCGAFPLLSSDIINFRFATTDEDVLTVVPGTILLYGNYAANEHFTFADNDAVPYGWTASASDGAGSTVKNNEFVMSIPAGGEAKAAFGFEALSTTPCFETLLFMPEAKAGASFTLMNGDTPAFTVSTKADGFYANDTLLRAFQGRMWYRLRVEFDIPAGTALVKINGKVLGTFDLAEGISSIDSLNVALSGTDAAELRFDDIKIHTLVDYTDYVPAPVKPAGEEKYNIGINICSLWRNDSTHWGWDCITPFDEIRPLLGYYDEGSPEVMDWEIKWMAEHGIDFQLFCWYGSSSNSPMKTTHLSSALMDGYFNAKYSDAMDFALLWEAANASRPSNLQEFKDYFLAYWMEYFFNDSRYMTIDNKAVMAVFGASQLVSSMGSPAAVKEAFDYMREEIKTLGYDGMIIMACGDVSETVRDCGFDAVYAYNWGKQGYDPEYTKQRIENNQNKNLVHTVPTISTGFNNIGWAGTRSPNMSVEDFRSIQEWVKDTALKKYENADQNWKKNFVMFSTWNEYGEGTYMMPSGLNEFGYLDAIRDAYTDGGAHEDPRPNDTQLARINHLFPSYRALIRPLRHETAPAPGKVMLKYDFTKDMGLFTANESITTQKVTDKGFYGVCTTHEPIININDEIGLDLAGVTHVKVTMRAEATDSAQLFFITDRDENWSEDQSFSFNVDGSADLKEYVIDVRGNAKWNGKLLKIRFDPIRHEGTFEIASIEFLGQEETQKYLVNGIEMEMDEVSVPYVDNNYHMMPFNPATGIHYYLNSFFTWNKADGVLTFEANHHSVSFTMGEKTAVIDGKATSLDCTPVLKDGLPMLPVEVLCSALGYTLDDADGNINIVTPQAARYEDMQNRTPYRWEFNLDGDMEGWTPGGNATGVVSDGVFHGTSASTDPVMMGPEISLDASQYDRIEIRMKNKVEAERGSVGIYFTTPNGSWSQDRYVSKRLAALDTGDEYYTYVLQMDVNRFWTGTITQLRLDPYDALGTFDIDYIRILKVGEPSSAAEEAGVVDPSKVAPIAFVNADAEGEMVEGSFYSNNADVTIVEDPDKAGNHAFLFMNNEEGQSWTYLRHKVTFTPNAYYLIEFDVKVLGTSGADSVDTAQIMVNLRYDDAGGKDHFVMATTAGTKDGWVHCKVIMGIEGATDNRDDDEFSIYINPVGGYGVNAMYDNLSITPTVG